MAPKPRDYTYRPPRKVRRGALRAALSLRAKEKALVIVDDFALDGGEDQGRPRGPHQAAEARRTRWWWTRRSNTKLHRGVRNLAKFDVLPPEGAEPRVRSSGTRRWCSPRGSAGQGAGGRAVMNTHRRHQGPAHHREAGQAPARSSASTASSSTARPPSTTWPARCQRCSRSPSRTSAPPSSAARSSAWAEHGQAPQLQEGDRHPEGRRQDRAVRGRAASAA